MIRLLRRECHLEERVEVFLECVCEGVLQLLCRHCGLFGQHCDQYELLWPSSLRCHPNCGCLQNLVVRPAAGALNLDCTDLQAAMEGSSHSVAVPAQSQ